jgi:ABC-type transport system involved in cytochrome c biogenesis permease subunit
MSLPSTPLGMLIAASVAVHALGLVASFLNRKAGWGAYAAAFGLAVVAVGWRWWQAGHVPLQVMFEIFLVLGALMFPLSLGCRWAWGIRSERSDMLMAAVLLVPAAFVFPHEARRLPPALQSVLFIPHVAAYLVAYVLMAKAAVQAERVLIARDFDRRAEASRAAYRLTLAGIVPMTLGLVLGAWWGKLAWGRFWNWDPKEMWSLATWLIFLGYFHLRGLYPRRLLRTQAVLLLVGVGAIVFTLVGVSLLMEGLHSYAT